MSGTKNLSLKQILGFSKKRLLNYSLIGLAIGIPTGAIEYLILMPAPSSPGFEIVHLLRDLAYMLLFVGLAEELLFRGLNVYLPKDEFPHIFPPP